MKIGQRYSYINTLNAIDFYRTVHNIVQIKIYIIIVKQYIETKECIIKLLLIQVSKLIMMHLN